MQSNRLVTLESRIKKLESLIKESREDDFDKEAAQSSFTKAVKSLGLQTKTVTFGILQVPGAETILSKLISGAKPYPVRLFHTGLKFGMYIDVSSEFDAPKWQYECTVTLDLMKTTEFTASILMDIINSSSRKISRELNKRIKDIDKELNGPKDTNTLIRNIGLVLHSLVDDIAGEKYDNIQAWNLIQRKKLTAAKAITMYHLLPDIAKDRLVNIPEAQLKEFIAEHSREINQVFKFEAEANCEFPD